MCFVHFVVWAAIGRSFFGHACCCCADQVFSSRPSEDYFKVIATEVLMTRTTASDWTPWYVDVPNTTRVQCLICGEDFVNKKSRMLSHLGFIPDSGVRDSNVKLCKNVKPDVLHAFRGCGGVAPDLPEGVELEHLQFSAGSAEPTCQGSQSSTMHASCNASQNPTAAFGPIRNSSGTGSQRQPCAGPSTARSLQQSTIPILHAEEKRRKCDMA